MVAIILVEPQNAGNVGAVARAMKNFGADELWVVNPQCDMRALEAVHRASHGVDVLKKAKVVASLQLVRKKFECLVATTSKTGSDYNLRRSPLSPEQGAALLQGRKKVGLVFGREADGLVNKEIGLCDFVVTIPAGKEYPVLNLSHAVAVLLYVLFSATGGEHVASHITFASQKEKDVLLKMIEQKIQKLPFSAVSKRRTQRLVWRRLIGKSVLTKREVYALFGFFKKIK